MSSTEEHQSEYRYKKGKRLYINDEIISLQTGIKNNKHKIMNEVRVFLIRIVIIHELLIYIQLKYGVFDIRQCKITAKQSERMTQKQ